MPNKLWSLLNIPYTGNEETRKIGYFIQEWGWSGFIENVIRPEYEWGCRNFFLRAPMGFKTTQDDGLLSFDGYIHAKHETPWLIKDFKSAWQYAHKEFKDATFMAYLGGLRIDQIISPQPNYGDGYTDPDFARAWNKKSTFFKRVFDSLYPFLAAGFVAYGLDTEGHVNENHPYFAIAELLHSFGFQVWNEPIPFQWSKNQHKYPWIVDWHMYPALPTLTKEHNPNGILINAREYEDQNKEQYLKDTKLALQHFDCAARLTDLNMIPQHERGPSRYRGLITDGYTIKDVLS